MFQNTPIVADGCIYMADTKGWVFALNAETGKLVWKTRMPFEYGYNNTKQGDGLGIIGSPVVDERRHRIYVPVADVGKPYVVALDQRSGERLWQTEVERFAGTYILSSVLLFDRGGRGTVVVTVGGDSTTKDFRGSIVMIDASSGKELKRTYVISDEKRKQGYRGGSIWATGAVDAPTGHLYVGTGNPGAGSKDDPHTDAILKVDIDRRRATLGHILDSYHGDNDGYLDASQHPPGCEAIADAVPYPANSGVCGQLDLDFGASPNLWHDKAGRLIVGELQKAGSYHAVRTDTMERVWRSVVGPPCFPCNASSSAYMNGRVFAVATPPGLADALDARDGSIAWTQPVEDVIHYQSVSAANGVAYTYNGMDLFGFDAKTGAPLVQKRLSQGDELGSLPTPGVSHPALAQSLGSNSNGIAIARGTVLATAGGDLVALRLPGPRPSAGGTARPDGGRAGTSEPRAKCAPAARFSLRLPRALRSARVSVARRHARVLRRHGRLIARIDLRGHRTGARVTVRIRGRTADGRPRFIRRTYRICRHTR